MSKMKIIYLASRSVLAIGSLALTFQIVTQSPNSTLTYFGFVPALAMAAPADADLPGDGDLEADDGQQTIHESDSIKEARAKALKEGKGEGEPIDLEEEEESLSESTDPGKRPVADPADDESAGQNTVADEIDNGEQKRVEVEQAASKVRISHDVLVDELLRRLNSPDERTRLEAGLALRRTTTLADVEKLVRILKKGNNRDKQLFIIESLANLQDKRAGEGLRFEVNHGDEETRKAAVTALGNLAFNWPISTLVKVLRREKDDEVRKRAASSLGNIGSPQAIYALRTSLGLLEESPGAKNAAFWALERARGEIDEERIDTDLPRGRRLSLMYKGTRYFFYHPANRREASATKSGLRPWLLVCLHDGDLRAEDVFNICYKAAKKVQLAVLVPVIDNINFPDYGTFNVRGQRADKRLLELIDHVGQNAQLSTREIYLFGYGVGGDLAHRFSMAYPKRIARAAYECNSFTLPDTEVFFPRGLAPSPLAPDVKVDMYSFLKTDQLLIMRKNNPEAVRTGKEFFEATTHYAEINGIRGRIAARTVDVKYEIWGEAEKFLLSYD